MDCIVHMVAKRLTQLSDFHFTSMGLIKDKIMGQGSLACCSPWGHKAQSTELLD